MKLRYFVYLSFILQIVFNPLTLSQSYLFNWGRSAGGPQQDHGADVAKDLSGNIYITGSFRVVAFFDTIQLVSHGEEDIFLAKLDPHGNFIWVIGVGGPFGDWFSSITVDASGNIYVFGSFQATAVFSGIELNSNGLRDIFIAKYNSNGNLVWIRQGGGTQDDYSSDIEIDQNGNLYALGDFQGSANFGGTQLISNGFQDIFLAKINSNGDYIWIKNAGGNNSESGNGVSIDSEGNPYITGVFRNISIFGIHQLVSYGVNDIFVSKLDSAGNFIWVKHAGSSSEDGGNDISLDTAGNVYITGIIRGSAYFDTIFVYNLYQTDIFTAKLDNSGNFKWAVVDGGVDYDYGNGIAAYPNGDSWTVGESWGSIFLRKFDSDGNEIWGESANIVDNESVGYNVLLGENGKLYVVGAFTGIFCNMYSYGLKDIFIIECTDNTVPVELVSFYSEVYYNSVILNFTTSSEINNLGFQIERKEFSSDWQIIGFVKGSGTITEPQNYSFTDNDLTAGRYSYRLKQLDFDGSFKYSNFIDVDISTSYNFSLGQNYPNPFNPITMINYELPKKSLVTLKIYDILGNEVLTLVDEYKSAGKHSAVFDGSSLSNGAYFYKLTSGDFVSTKKMLLLK